MIDIIHKTDYKIIFKEPVDYFSVVLQKQIDLHVKLDISEHYIIIKKLEIFACRFGEYFFKSSLILFHSFLINLIKSL